MPEHDLPLPINVKAVIVGTAMCHGSAHRGHAISVGSSDRSAYSAHVVPVSRPRSRLQAGRLQVQPDTLLLGRLQQANGPNRPIARPAPSSYRLDHIAIGHTALVLIAAHHTTVPSGARDGIQPLDHKRKAL